MSEPRFIVTELTGYKISDAKPTEGATHESTDYYVQDRLYLYAVVAAFTPQPNGRPFRATLKQRAEDECDRLNAWWQEELACG